MNIVLVLMFSTPVILAALGEAIGQKSGVINIGLEGMMLASAYASMIVTYQTHAPWLGLATGLFFACLIMVFQTIFVLKLACDQVVVGTAINLMMLGLTSGLYRSRFGQSGSLLSVEKLPQIGGFDPIMIFALVITPVLWWVVNKTRFGLVVKASGEYPMAAEAAGFSALRARWNASVIAAIFAGLAGAHLTLGINGSFAENVTQGRGFLAIAMVTFGRWNVIWVLLAGLGIGVLESYQYGAQAMGSTLPKDLLIALPYLVALLVLVIMGKGTSAPEALAIPFRRKS